MSVPFAVGGMHRLTTLDFPGVVSAIVFTQGCNLHCPYCHNHQLIARRSKTPPLETESVLSFLRKRAGILDGLVISGGEPTLQPGLAGFCRQVKSLGYKIKLDSNGSRPDVLRTLLEQELLDYLALDLKTAPDRYYPLLSSDTAMADALVQSIALTQEGAVPHELRVTCVSPIVQPEDAPLLAAIAGRLSPLILQRAILGNGARHQNLTPISQKLMEDMAGQTRSLGARTLLR